MLQPLSFGVANPSVCAKRRAVAQSLDCGRNVSALLRTRPAPRPASLGGLQGVVGSLRRKALASHGEA